MTYRAELSERVLGQLGDFPAKAFDDLIAAMSAVVGAAGEHAARLAEAF